MKVLVFDDYSNTHEFEHDKISVRNEDDVLSVDFCDADGNAVTASAQFSPGHWVYWMVISD